ncbi:MAG: PAS domain S-box protein [Candidatus Heimdallarchaeota archaeon]|nr:PAS domain S-box protein [Candidatus Heimdallarchaeota archaeon]
MITMVSFPAIEDIYKYISTNLPFSIFVGDFEGNKIFLNKAFEDHSGYRESKIDKISIFDLVHPEDIGLIQEKLQQVAKGKPITDLEFRFKAANGEYLYLSTDVVPLVDNERKIIGFLSISINITASKQIDEDKYRLMKLELLASLSGGIIHDYNNILSSMLANINLLQMKIKEPEQEDLLEEILESLIEAKNLTNKFLTFSKGGIPVIKSENLKEIVENSLVILSGSNSIAEIKMPEISINADERQIFQLFSNIIENAVEAMPGGGKVIIEAKEVKRESTNIPSLTADEYVEIHISDEGEGMDEFIKSRIFEPYFSTKSYNQGMGLAVAYSIVKNHEGHIDFTSEIGKGTTFRILLPAKKKHAKVKIEQPSTKIDKLRGNILFMDDNRPIRFAIKRMAKVLGINVDLVVDGEEAIQYYLDYGPYDLVILDLTIPGGMGGRETIKRLLEIDPDIKAIVSSGYSNDHVLSNFKEFGFIDLLYKPYDFYTFKNSLAKYLG